MAHNAANFAVRPGRRLFAVITLFAQHGRKPESQLYPWQNEIKGKIRSYGRAPRRNCYFTTISLRGGGNKTAGCELFTLWLVSVLYIFLSSWGNRVSGFPDDVIKRVYVQVTGHYAALLRPATVLDAPVVQAVRATHNRNCLRLNYCKQQTLTVRILFQIQALAFQWHKYKYVVVLAYRFTFRAH